MNLLERYAVLRDRLKSRLPNQCHIAGIGSLKPPGQEGRYSVAAHYTILS